MWLYFVKYHLSFNHIWLDGVLDEKGPYTYWKCLLFFFFFFFRLERRHFSLSENTKMVRCMVSCFSTVLVLYLVPVLYLVLVLAPGTRTCTSTYFRCMFILRAVEILSCSHNFKYQGRVSCTSTCTVLYLR